MINFISDTVTKPDSGMLEYMMQAKVGDDTFGQDPTVNQLQAMVAEMFGKDEAIFCPSGTMTNQIAIKAHTQPGQQVICSDKSHIYHYEAGGMAFHSGVTAGLIPSVDGRFTRQDVVQKYNTSDFIHSPDTALVSIENTVNKAGGSIWSIDAIREIRSYCLANKIPMHLDGARLFNALVETGETPIAYGELFESISICFSKGLGAPVGSVLIGDTSFIQKARRIRKIMGGMMRQSGYLAAAAIYALENNIPGLKEDHDKAKYIEGFLKKLNYIRDIRPVETNIVIFELSDPYSADQLLKALVKENILIIAMDAFTLRITTHRDITWEDVYILEKVMKSLSI